MARVAGTILRTMMAPAAAWTVQPGTTWPQRRSRAAIATRATGLVPRGVQIEQDYLGGLACEITTPVAVRDDLVLLFLHGGGWTVGSPATHRAMVARLAAMTRLRTWSIDYRLAPEHVFPAALDDCVSAYEALLAAGHPRIVVAGDSAGGGLTASLAIAARDRGLVQPQALGLLCPVVDLTQATLGQLVDTRREPVLTRRVLTEAFAAYAGDHPRADPLLSPLYADLADLPPIVLDSASDDPLSKQDLAFGHAIRAAGGVVSDHHQPGAWHVFHQQAGIWPVATRALENFADRLVEAAQSQR